ncbi:MAG: hypothetical protein AAB596_02795 [Patescibacteria group bacterium]
MKDWCENEIIEIVTEQIQSLLREKQLNAPLAPLPKFSIITTYCGENGADLKKTCEIKITFYAKDGLPIELIGTGETPYDAYDDLTTHPSNLLS